MAIYSTFSKSRMQLSREIQKDELIIKKAGKIEVLPGSVQRVPSNYTCETGVALPNSIESVECLDDQLAGQTGKFSAGIGAGNVDMPPVEARDPIVNVSWNRIKNQFNLKMSDTNQVMNMYFGNGNNLTYEHAEEHISIGVKMPGELDVSRIQGSVGKDEDRQRRIEKERKELARKRRGRC